MMTTTTAAITAAVQIIITGRAGFAFLSVTPVSDPVTGALFCGAELLLQSVVLPLDAGSVGGVRLCSNSLSYSTFRHSAHSMSVAGVPVSDFSFVYPSAQSCLLPSFDDMESTNPFSFLVPVSLIHTPILP